MKGDYTRLPWAGPETDSRVLMQQGRILLDADWNAAAELANRRERTLIADVVGPHGGPAIGGGYAVREVQSFQLSGKGGFKVRDNAALQFVDDGDAFTIETRVKADAPGVVVSTRCVSPVWGGYQLEILEDGTPVFSRIEAGGLPQIEGFGDIEVVPRPQSRVERRIGGIMRLPKDEFSHVVVCYADGALTMYLNGDMIAHYGACQDLVRGAEAQLGKYKGNLGRTRFWGRALSAREVRTLARGGNPPPEALLIDYDMAEPDQKTNKSPVLHSVAGSLAKDAEFENTGPNPKAKDAPDWTRELWLTQGRYYVDGVRCENPQSRPLDELAEHSGTDRSPNHFLLYLDAWERQVTALERPAIRESALPGDTSTRVEVLSKVGLLPVSLPPADDAEWGDWRPDDAPQWWSLIALSRAGRGMQVRRASSGQELDNLLYRVEVHNGGTPRAGNAPDGPTFKWSRLNGSEAYGVQDVDKESGDVTLQSGYPERITIQADDWVELETQEAARENQRLGLYRVKSVDEARHVVTLYDASDLVLPKSGWTLLRRWNQQGEDGVVSMQADVAIPLEDGIEIKFAAGGHHLPGNYWAFPVRLAPGSFSSAADAYEAPHGEGHVYAPLALVEVRAKGKARVIREFRQTIPALTISEERDEQYVLSAGDSTIKGTLRIEGDLSISGKVKAENDLEVENVGTFKGVVAEEINGQTVLVAAGASQAESGSGNAASIIGQGTGVPGGSRGANPTTRVGLLIGTGANASEIQSLNGAALNLNPRGGDVTVGAGAFRAGGPILAEGLLSAKGAIATDGTVSAKEVAATGAVTAGGLLTANGGISLTGALNATGDVSAGGKLNANGVDVVDAQGVVRLSGDVQLRDSGSGEAVIAAQETGKKPISLTFRIQKQDGKPADALKLNSDGRITASGDIATSGAITANGNLGTTGDLYTHGHVFLYAYEGDGQSGTAYVQARDLSYDPKQKTGSNIALQFRVQSAGVNFDIMRLNPANGGSITFSGVTFNAADFLFLRHWIDARGGGTGVF